MHIKIFGPFFFFCFLQNQGRLDPCSQKLNWSWLTCKFQSFDSKVLHHSVKYKYIVYMYRAQKMSKVPSTCGLLVVSIIINELAQILNQLAWHNFPWVYTSKLFNIWYLKYPIFRLAKVKVIPSCTYRLCGSLYDILDPNEYFRSICFQLVHCSSLQVPVCI